MVVTPLRDCFVAYAPRNDRKGEAPRNDRKGKLLAMTGRGHHLDIRIYPEGFWP